MPRKPRINHPLREIRHATGLNQRNFGQLVGVSNETIQKIENGRMPMSKQLAHRVRHQTGAWISALEKDGKMIYGVFSKLLDQEITPESYNLHKARLKGEDKAEFNSLAEDKIEAAKRCLDLLLRVAARKSPATFWCLSGDIETFAAECMDSYELSVAATGLIKDDFVDMTGGKAHSPESVATGMTTCPFSTADEFWSEYQLLSKIQKG